MKTLTLRRALLAGTFAVAAALIAALSSCAVPTLAGELSVKTGSITVTVGSIGSGSEARTIVPDIASSAASYDITVTCVNSLGTKVVSDSVSGTQVKVFTDLEPGEITVNVRAKNAGGTEIAAGSANVTLAEGGSATAIVPLTLVKTATGTGSLNLTLRWPQTGATAFSWYIDGAPQTTPAITTSGTDYVATLSATGLTSGAHQARITMNLGGLETCSKLEAVNIYDNLVSNRWIQADGTLSDTLTIPAADFSNLDQAATLYLFSGAATASIPLSGTSNVATAYNGAPTNTVSLLPVITKAGQEVSYLWNDSDETHKVKMTSGTVVNLTMPVISDTSSRLNTLKVWIAAPDTSATYSNVITIRSPLHVSVTTNPMPTADFARALASNYDAFPTTFDNNVILDNSITLNGSAATAYGTGTLLGTLNGNGYTITVTNAVTATGNKGLIGTNNGLIENLHVVYQHGFVGNATATANGGIVGENYGTICRCSIAGSITGTQNYTGGIAGANLGNIIECYSTSTITGTNNVGGIAGSDGNGASIMNCYNRGSVKGSGSYVGGITGILTSSGTNTVTSCYSTGKVTGAGNTGGVAGIVNSGTITSCYYDSDTAGQSDTGKGSGIADSAMKTESAYAGWDFASMWTFTAGKNGGYPHLRNVEPTADIVIPAASYTSATLVALFTDRTKDYTLTDDITITDPTTCTPIGTLAAPFTGTFDGNGHTISGLQVSNSGGDAGFFGYVGAGAVIKNVRLTNVAVVSAGTVLGDDGVGGLVGENFGTIIHCSVAGSVTGFSRVGGLVGNNRAGSTIQECYSIATVASTYASGWACAGGLVGSTWGTISNSYARGSVTSSGPAGGFAGSNETGAITTNCYATGVPSGSTNGAFAGTSNGTTTNSFYNSDNYSVALGSGTAQPTLYGYSTAGMKTDIYSGASWNIAASQNASYVWGIDGTTINNGYPYLQYFGSDTIGLP